MPPCLVAEAACALVVHSELDEVSFGRRRVGLGVGQILTGNDRLGIEHVQRPVNAIAVRERIAAPPNDFARRKRCGHLRHREVLSNEIDIVLRDEILARHSARLDQLGERAWPPDCARHCGSVLLGGIRFLRSVRCEERLQPGAGAVLVAGSSRSGRCDFGVLQGRIDARQRFLQRLGLVGYLEFQERRFLDDVLGALWIVDAGKLDDDAVVASLLHDGLGNPELVDAVANDLERVVDGLALVRYRTLRVIDFKREVHPALEVEAPF